MRLFYAHHFVNGFSENKRGKFQTLFYFNMLLIKNLLRFLFEKDR